MLAKLRTDGLLVYRKILKMHRTLPPKMQAMGNVYLRDEFKRHHYPEMENFTEDHYRIFLAAWRNYVVELKL
jgi:hypothetical protein